MMPEAPSPKRTAGLGGLAVRSLVRGHPTGPAFHQLRQLRLTGGVPGVVLTPRMTSMAAPSTSWAL